MTKRIPLSEAEFQAMMTMPPRTRPPSAKQLAAMKRALERMESGEEMIPHADVVRRAKEAP